MISHAADYRFFNKQNGLGKHGGHLHENYQNIAGKYL
jgi:hypothetical protein